MRIEPHIERGPDFDGCLDYCHHEKTMGQKAIRWQTWGGKEYGMALSFALPLAPTHEELIDKMLWLKFEAWRDSPH